MSGFPGVGFHAPQASGGIMPKSFHVRGIPNGAVVGGENEQCVPGHARLIQRVQHTTDFGVHHLRKVAVLARAALANKFARRHPRGV